MPKTIVFYGTNPKAAEDKFADKGDKDTRQIVQASAWQGERLEGDKIEFMDDVPAGERQRIEEMWGKFDNRQNVEHGGATSLGGVERTPASDRRNLNPETRVDDPAKVKENQVEKRPGFAPKPDPRPADKSHEDHKGVGLDQTTGNPTSDRNRIPR